MADKLLTGSLFELHTWAGYTVFVAHRTIVSKLLIVKSVTSN